jgi:putative transposase
MRGGMRKIVFQNQEFYHIYNRGVDKREIFHCPRDYIRFIIGIRGFNRENPIGSLHALKELNSLAKEFSSLKHDKLVNIICYCLNPNHYHFILQQNIEDGIPKFMQKISTGYTNYFNSKYNRPGSLFQGTYKAIHIKSDSKLIRLSAYINGNPEIHKISSITNYPWSSYQDYIGKRNGTLCDKKVILDQFENIKEYKDLTKYIIKESQSIKNEI